MAIFYCSTNERPYHDPDTPHRDYLRPCGAGLPRRAYCSLHLRTAQPHARQRYRKGAHPATRRLGSRPRCRSRGTRGERHALCIGRACWSARVRLGGPCLLCSLCREYDALCAPQREQITPRAPCPFYCGRHLLCGTRRCCAPLAATTACHALDSPTPSICAPSLFLRHSPRFAPRTKLPDKQRRQLVQALQDARAR